MDLIVSLCVLRHVVKAFMVEAKTVRACSLACLSRRVASSLPKLSSVTVDGILSTFPTAAISFCVLLNIELRISSATLAMVYSSLEFSLISICYCLILSMIRSIFSMTSFFLSIGPSKICRTLPFSILPIIVIAGSEAIYCLMRSCCSFVSCFSSRNIFALSLNRLISLCMYSSFIRRNLSIYLGRPFALNLVYPCISISMGGAEGKVGSFSLKMSR